MKTLFLKYWDKLTSSFWFIPAVMAVLTMGLVYVTIRIDTNVTSEWIDDYFWTYSWSTESANQILSTIAGSMITIAGVVFSITLVALSLASNQFGPRTLRNFMADTSNQVVMGTFISTFLFSIMVLRSIRDHDNFQFIPHISISTSVLLSLVSIGVLIYFIHHVAVSVQADHIIDRIGKGLIKGINSAYPQMVKEKSITGSRKKEEMEGNTPEKFEEEALEVSSREDGYVQYIDNEMILEIASEKDLVIKLNKMPGDYIVEGETILYVWPTVNVTEEIKEKLSKTVVAGMQRTSLQDFKFDISQLVEIAVRSLSPGINDPFSAMRCIDRLGSALIKLSQKEIPSHFVSDKEDKLRLILIPIGFEENVASSFNQIRQNSRGNAAVTIRLLETIDKIVDFACKKEDFAVLLLHADLIYKGANETIPEEADLMAIEKVYSKIRKACTEKENRN
jgi:uncharacterized membrane protein